MYRIDRLVEELLAEGQAATQAEFMLKSLQRGIEDMLDAAPQIPDGEGGRQFARDLARVVRLLHGPLMKKEEELTGVKLR